MSDKLPLMRATFDAGSVTSAPADAPTNHLAKNSENCYIAGTGKVEIFKGVTLKPDVEGGSVFNTVVETYASLGQATDTSGFGSVFNVFSALFFIGAGLLRLAGESLLVNASSTLSLLIKRNGSYTDPGSGLFQAGLAEPSAPEIRAVAPPAGFTGKNNGVVAVVVWRIRSATGARSIQSEISNVAGAFNQSIAVTVGLADANGQDYWGYGVTKNGEGEFGSLFQLGQISESEIAGSLSRTDTATNSASLDITSATGGFNSTHIGWQARIVSVSPAMDFTSYVTAVPNSTTLTLAAMPPSTTANATLTLTRAVDGQTRTFVIEWRDGDLYGKPFAPTRDFPPPAARFGGTLEDVAFVDGALADGVDSISDTVKGAAIAVSERGRPESYSPDNYIFTDDTPTALVKANGYYARFTKSSMYVIRYTGGEKPLSIEPAWASLGVLYQNNACIGEGNRLYTWSGQPFRMGADGLPESFFAARVIEDFREWTDPQKVVLGTHSIGFTAVCYAYEKIIRAYFPAQGAWGAPFNLSGKITGNIKACVTVGNQLFISTSDGADDYLYDFNIGTGMVAKIQTPWRDATSFLDTIHTATALIRADNTDTDVVIDVFADYDESAPAQTHTLTPARVGRNQLIVQPNVADASAHSVRITMESTSPTASAGVERIETFGETNSITY